MEDDERIRELKEKVRELETKCADDVDACKKEYEEK